MLENIRLAFVGVWTHKMRSCLTMLGIIIGIASIIAISSTIMGTNEQIKQNLIGAGNNAVEIQLHQNDYPIDMEGGVPQGIPTVSQQAMEEIAALDNVEAAAQFISAISIPAFFTERQASPMAIFTGSIQIILAYTDTRFGKAEAFPRRMKRARTKSPCWIRMRQTRCSWEKTPSARP